MYVGIVCVYVSWLGVGVGARWWEEERTGVVGVGWDGTSAGFGDT